MADDTTGRGAEEGVVAGDVAADPAHCGALETALGTGGTGERRQRRGQAHDENLLVHVSEQVGDQIEPGQNYHGDAKNPAQKVLAHVVSPMNCGEEG